MKNLKMSKISTKNILKKIFKSKTEKKVKKKTAKKVIKKVVKPKKVKKVTKKVAPKKTKKILKKTSSKTTKVKKISKKSEIQEEINAQEVQSQTTTDATQHSEMPPHQPKNVIDQFANNSPSIADRAQKNIDDSTSHLLRRGGQISLNSLIDLNRRFLIINDVFGGKRMNFDKEIEQLNKMPNQDSAIEHLNHHVVKTYNVNTATKGFEILKKVVARRFES